MTTKLQKTYQETVDYYKLVKDKPIKSIKQRALHVGLRILIRNYNRELAAINRKLAASKVVE